VAEVVRVALQEQVEQVALVALVQRLTSTVVLEEMEVVGPPVQVAVEQERQALVEMVAREPL